MLRQGTAEIRWGGVAGVADAGGEPPRVGQLQQATEDPQRPDQDDIGREGQQRLEAGRGPVVLGEPARLDPLAEGGHEGVEVGQLLDRPTVPVGG